MEGLFIWIVLFAGVTLAFLGVLLIASERELKTKRREVETLLAKLENAADVQAETSPGSPQPDHTGELAGLRAKNQELQDQVAGLTAKLDLSRRSLEELETTHRSYAGDEHAAQELRAANDRLTSELNQLRSRLQASEAQLQGSVAASDYASYNAQAQQEIADLRQQLEQSRNKIHELEVARQRLTNLDEIEVRHNAERQNLEARISALNQEISAGREKLGEFDALRVRAAEAERTQQTLREEIRRHEEETSRWQARLAEAEEHRQRLAALQAPLDNLLAKHATLVDRQREFQEDMTALRRLIAAPAESTDGMNSTPAASPSNTFGKGVIELQQTATAEQPEPRKARRFGIFSVVFLLTGGALGAWYFSADSTQSTVSNSAASIQQQSMRAPAPMEISSSAGAPLAKAPAATAEPAVKEKPKPVVKENRDVVKSPSAQPTTRTVTYEVTRASRVYAAPSELSQSLGDIEPGTKVSAVSSSDGWLEIYSKHGRPPGFIRKEAAARVAQN
jgi:myosin heavy subunit